MASVQGAVQGSFGRVAVIVIDRAVPEHVHHHCHAHFKLSGADTEFVVAGQRCRMSADSGVLVGAWQPHAYPHPPGAPPAKLLSFYIEPAWLAALDRRFGCAGSAAFFANPAVALTPGLRHSIWQLGECLAGGGEADRVAEDLLQDVMCEALLHFSRWREIGAAAQQVRDRRVRRALGLLHSGPDLGFDSIRLARDAGLSRSHLFALFREHIGATPGLVFNALRMEQAYSLMARDDARLGDIAAALGFRAQGHFTRFFRQNLGVAPKVWRNAVRQC